MSCINGPWIHETETQKRFDSLTGEPKEIRHEWIKTNGGERIVGIVLSDEIEAKDAARLISAAPELLNALKLAQGILESRRLDSMDQNPLGFKDIIGSAIAKAEGIF